MDWGGENLLQFTNHPGYDGQPAWSPNGKKLLFVSNRDGNYKIYRMKADGSEVTRLTNDEHGDFTPAWSPDGNSPYVSRGGEKNLDYFSGPFTGVIESQTLFNRASYILYDGDYYITESCIGSREYTSFVGHCDNYSKLDFYPDAGLTDIIPPTTRILPLPEYMPAGPLVIAHEGYDRGGSGFLAFYVDARSNFNESWRELGSFSPDYSADIIAYNGSEGEIVQFRSRGRDKAHNFEAWPSGDVEATVHYYRFKLNGLGLAADVNPRAAKCSQPVVSLPGRFDRYGRGFPGFDR